MEEESVREALQRAFSDLTIVSFSKFGDFLVAFNDLAAEVCLIISEDSMGLADPTPDLQEWIKLLEESFPEALLNWDGKNIPKSLLKHLQAKGLKTPILIYTHSYREWIDKAVLQDAQVTYLEKAFNLNKLVLAVHGILSRPA